MCVFQFNLLSEHHPKNVYLCASQILSLFHSNATEFNVLNYKKCFSSQLIDIILAEKQCS